MSADTAEYDAFGPWVYPVRTPQDVPRLYRDHPLDLDAAHLVIKVPRTAARRDVTAGMDLYDHLLALDADGLLVLSRRPDDAPARDAARAGSGGPSGGRPYEVRRVAHRDVVAVVDEVDLLDGHLHVHTRDGRVLTVAYNGSSATHLQQFVDELRVLATADGPARGAGSEASGTAGRGRSAPPAGLTGEDLAVFSAYREAALHRPDLVVRAAHGRVPARARPGLRGALGDLLAPRTLHAAVIATDDDVVEVFGRRTWVGRRRAPVHSLSRLVVPLRALDRVSVRPHPRWAGAVEVALVAGRASPTVVVPEGSDAARVLARLRRG